MQFIMIIRELHTVTVEEIPFLWGNSESQIIENSHLPWKDYEKPQRTLKLIGFNW